MSNYNDSILRNYAQNNLRYQAKSHPCNLIKETDGRYSVEKPLTVNQFFECAKYLLNSVCKKRKYINSSNSKDYLIAELAGCKHEVFCAVFLTSKHTVIAFEKIAMGTVNRAQIHARVLVQKALAHNAAAVILAHNHPSGCLVPSDEDIKTTDNLKSVLSTIDVKVIDHIIVAAGSAFSLMLEEML